MWQKPWPGTACPAGPCAAADPGCDAWLLATTSEAPFCEPPPAAPAVVVSLGADAAGQRELADAWAGRARLWVDSADAVNYGDLLAWRRLGLIDDAPPPDLLALLADPPAPAVVGASSACSSAPAARCTTT